MHRFRFAPFAPGVAIATAMAALAPVRDASAFGGCFQGAAAPSKVAVTDHRVAFAIEPSQTVLWDQVRFTGAPADFAWVLPVRPGAVLSLSHEAWFDALDASTEPVVIAGVQECSGPPPPSNTSGPSSPFGCGGGTPSAPKNTFVDAGQETVLVVTDHVVGPYAVATLRASDGASIGAWLTQNGYAVPSAVAPALAAYAAAGFDFLALKLRPGAGVSAMQPVRVVTPGSDTTLPLRMLAAGAGGSIGIKLFVLSRGRYHPENFPDVTLDPFQITFDYGKQQSNYEAVVAQTLAAGAATGWLTESAETAGYAASAGSNPPLTDTYLRLCQGGGLPPSTLTCASGPAGGDAGSPDANAGAPGVDAAVDDSGVDAARAAAGAEDASHRGDADASGADDASPGAWMGPQNACTLAPAPLCDDLDLATVGTDLTQVWVTRLRANLPAGALVTDLTLTTTPQQSTTFNILRASRLTDPNSLCADNSEPGCSIDASPSRARRVPFAVLAFGALFALWAARRKR